jgi:hypothetical protein
MKAPALLRSYLLVGTRTIYTVRIRARCVRTSFPQLYPARSVSDHNDPKENRDSNSNVEGRIVNRLAGLEDERRSSVSCVPPDKSSLSVPMPPAHHQTPWASLAPLYRAQPLRDRAGTTRPAWQMGARPLLFGCLDGLVRSDDRTQSFNRDLHILWWWLIDH